jgi:hypothetical protein
MKLLAVSQNLLGVHKYRIQDPHEQRADIKQISIIEKKNVLKYDLVIFNTVLGHHEYSIHNIKKIKKLGIPIIMDIDDYWETNENLPFHDFYNSNNIKDTILKSLETVNGITTTTQFFKDTILQYNNNVEVFPNAIDINNKHWASNKSSTRKTRIGWVGGSSHVHDLELLKNMMEKLSKSKLKEYIEIIICNVGGVYDEYFKILTANSSLPYRIVKFTDIETYGELYNEIDIILIPLQNTVFNSYKSQLKVIEAGIHKCSVIASAVGPNLIDLNENNSYLVYNESDWYSAIESEIYNKTNKHILLYNHIKMNYDLKIINNKRYTYYKTILNGL